MPPNPFRVGPVPELLAAVQAADLSGGWGRCRAASRGTCVINASVAERDCIRYCGRSARSACARLPVVEVCRSNGREPRHGTECGDPMWPADGLFRSIVPVHLHRARLKGALHQRIRSYVGSMVAFGKECPLLGFNQLRQAEFEEELLWTPVSVSFMKSLILIVWLACFAALTTALGSFVVFQMGQKYRK